MQDRNSQRLQELCHSFLETTAKMCSRHDFLRCVERKLSSIAGNVMHPFSVAVFGKMKRGKSSIVNSLLGRTLAITDQTEATATINVVSYADPGSDLLSKFEIHWKDAPPETLPLRDLKMWTGPDGQFDRIRYIQMYADAPSLKYHEIIDTPGTESTVKKHQAITQDFIDPTVQDGRKPDALIYVFDYNVEAKDLNYLNLYQQFGTSDSFNVLGVLHYWDVTYVNNVRTGFCFEDIVRHAAAKRKELGRLVTDVIPVSAPLAIFVNSCPDRDALIGRALSLFSGKSDKEMWRLSLSQKEFEADAERVALWKDLRKSIPPEMPESSAKIVLIEAARSTGGVDDVVRRLRTLSGIDRLEDVLDKKFFSRSEIVRQRHTCNEIAGVKKEFDRCVADRIRLLRDDSHHWNRLTRLELEDDELKRWACAKSEAMDNELQELNSGLSEIDKLFLDSPVSKLCNDVAVKSWMEKAGFFSDEEVETVACFLDSFLAGEDGASVVEHARIEAIVAKALRGLKMGLLPSDGREMVGHLQSRLLKRK